MYRQATVGRRAERRILWAGSLLSLALVGVASASSLVGSVHDLSAGPVARGPGAEGLERQACLYCHTPRTSASAKVPLWNPQAPPQPYVIGRGGEEAPSFSPAPGLTSNLCLTCHDGSVATDAVVRTAQGRSRSAGLVSDASGVEVFADSGGSLDAGSGATHPVGVVYRAAQDLVPAPADGQFPNGVRLIDGKVECGTCHNPHSGSSPPFLVTSNVGSALCYTCHLK